MPRARIGLWGGGCDRCIGFGISFFLDLEGSRFSASLNALGLEKVWRKLELVSYSTLFDDVGSILVPRVEEQAKKFP